MLLATMTHMEISFIDDRDEEMFLAHVEQLRYGMDLADEFTAKLTIESEKPFARANTTWGLNMLREVIDRGHGVGTHCDIGFHDPAVSVEQFAIRLAENKELVDALVGPENNRGFSGGGGFSDWAAAGALAGYEYVDGIVGLHYLSMPMSARPDNTWTDEYILETAYHDQAPVDLLDRIYPFKVADGRDFTADEDGVILVSSGELGRVDRLAEEAAGEECGANCPLTTEDVDLALATIIDIAAQRDPTRLTKLTYYFAINNFDPQNVGVLRSFFSRTKALQDSGILTWATQGDVLDAYNADAAQP